MKERKKELSTYMSSVQRLLIFSTFSAVNGTTCIMLSFPLFKATQITSDEQQKNVANLTFFLLATFFPHKSSRKHGNSMVFHHNAVNVNLWNNTFSFPSFLFYFSEGRKFK